MNHKNAQYSILETSDDLHDVDYLENKSRLQVPHRPMSFHLIALYATILVLLATLIRTGHLLAIQNYRDPSLAPWSPATHAVQYTTVTFEPYFLGYKDSPWTRSPKQVKDSLWDSLYQFGISGISKDDASKLLNQTLPSPHDPDTYMVQLEVFHLLHCLNILRKTIYPDEYPELWSYFDNGTVNHNTRQAVHTDHCIDALRQSIICTSDVTPISFVENRLGRGVFPDVTATHICRDFNRITEWARAHEVKSYLGT